MGWGGLGLLTTPESHGMHWQLGIFSASQSGKPWEGGQSQGERSPEVPRRGGVDPNSPDHSSLEPLVVRWGHTGCGF